MKKEKSCGAVVFKREKNRTYFLIEKMTEGHYSLPKGHVEAGENEIQTAEREILEETGLSVRIDPSFRHSVTYSPYADCEKDVVFFVAEYVGGNLRIQKGETEELDWLEEEEAVQRLTYKSDKETLRLASRHILGNVGSRIALGFMRINDMSAEQVETLIRKALDAGVYKFDLADIYGKGRCEELVGEVLSAHPELREKMYLQSKVGIRKEPKRYDLSYEHIVEGVKASVERMKCGYLDSLLLHRPDILMDAEEVGKAIAFLLKEGLIRDFGVSNFSSSEILYLERYLPCPIRYNQVQLGIGNTTMIDQIMFTNVPAGKVSKEADDLFFFLKRKNIVIQCWSPFQVGFFEGVIFDESRYPELNAILADFAERYHTSKCAIATAFLLKIDPRLWVVTGSTSWKHIEESLDGEKISLSREDFYELYAKVIHWIP